MNETDDEPEIELLEEYYEEYYLDSVIDESAPPEQTQVIRRQRSDLPARPVTRGECLDTDGPCPWVSCSHHLMLDVSPSTGHIKQRFDDIDDMPETCALDVADSGENPLHEVGRLVGLTPQAIEQAEAAAFDRLRRDPTTRSLSVSELSELLRVPASKPGVVKVRLPTVDSGRREFIESLREQVLHRKAGA